MSTVTLTVELKPQEAAALARLCDKFTHSHAAQFLYPHVDANIRRDQADHMADATGVLEKALGKAGVNAWPWIECGQVAE